jgi:hypothetical protein
MDDLAAVAARCLSTAKLYDLLSGNASFDYSKYDDTESPDEIDRFLRKSARP